MTDFECNVTTVDSKEVLSRINIESMSIMSLYVIRWSSGANVPESYGLRFTAETFHFAIDRRTAVGRVRVGMLPRFCEVEDRCLNSTSHLIVFVKNLKA